MNKDLDCLRDPVNGEAMVVKGDELIAKSGHHYPIVNGIPRFVHVDNYSSDFGTQWNMFPKTQLDSFSGVNVSEARLERCLQGDLKKLNAWNEFLRQRLPDDVKKAINFTDEGDSISMSFSKIILRAKK